LVFRRRQLARALAVVAALSLGGILLAVIHLRADKRDVFTAVAGTLAQSRVLESLPTERGTARHLELVNHRGESVASAWVRRPTGLADDYRVVFVYSGRETGAKVLDLVPDRDDLVLVAPQYPYEEPRDLWEHVSWPYSVRRAAFRTVAGGMLAVSHLEVAEGLDAGRILVVGASLGSAFAVAHAALDPRVPAVVVIHGGGDLPLIVRTIEERRGRPWRGRLLAGLAAVLVHSFEPLRYVGDIAPRELVVIGARGDRQFPAASTQALYDRASEPKSLRWTGGGHLRSARDATLDEVLAEIERQLAR
jgi:fermentation-respiration switch protein FrsA (DUF1100 family)